MTEHVNKADDYDSSEDETAKTFKDRLEDMPAYTMTVGGLQSLYSTLKGNAYLTSYFDTAESVAGSLSSAAKPVVMAATDLAFKVAKPVVGEVSDPAASIDGCASEVLAKVQEKLPCMKQNPYEIVESAKSSAKDAASYYMEKVQGLAVTQTAVKQLDNAVSLSDLVVELCFPTDGSNAEDMVELEQAEEDEDMGVVARARNVRAKAYRRGSRRLMSFKQVRVTVDMVQYAQNRISETTGKLMQGSSYVASNSTGSSEASQNVSNESQLISPEGNAVRDFVSESWDSVHKTSMFLPNKAMEMTGEIYTSAKEMVFAYSNANNLNEMPHNVGKVVQSYYNNKDGILTDVKDKVVGFAYVPAQVISNYMQSNRMVQWIIPNALEAETIQLIEIVDEDSTT